MKVNITEAILFDSLLEIEHNKSHYFDIHNDFDLKSITYDKIKELFVLIFDEIKGKTQIHLIFEKPLFIEFNINFSSIGLTLDNLHRGKYEIDGKLYENYEDKKCFYLEFVEEEGNLSLLCSKSFFEIKSKDVKIIDLNSQASENEIK